MTVTTITHSADNALTISAWGTSLIAGDFALSAVVDNDTTAYVDVLIGGEIAYNTDVGIILAADSYDIYVLAQYKDLATAIGGGIGTAMAWGSEEVDGTGLVLANAGSLIASVSPQLTTPDSTQDVHWGPIGLAQFFGGVMPKDWGLMLHNNTNDSTLGAGSTVSWYGITYTNT